MTKRKGRNWKYFVKTHFYESITQLKRGESGPAPPHPLPPPYGSPYERCYLYFNVTFKAIAMCLKNKYYKYKLMSDILLTVFVT